MRRVRARAARRAVGVAAVALGLVLPLVGARADVSEILAPMLGVWADHASLCIDEPGVIADGRLEVRSDGVETFVEMWGVEAWRVDGEGLLADAMLGMEGEGEETGPYEIRLELFPEGILAFGGGGTEPRLLERCPEGTRLR